MEIPPPSLIPEEQLGPSPLLSVSLQFFLDTHCRTVHNFSTMSKSFGDYIRFTIDPQELYTHVDYPELQPTLSHIYPKSAWLEAVRKFDLAKQRSEADRVKRFEIEEKHRILLARYKQREEKISYFLNILERRFNDFARSKTKEFKLSLIMMWLEGGGNAQAREKIGIDISTIEEFMSLPKPDNEDEKSELFKLMVGEPIKEIPLTDL